MVIGGDRSTSCFSRPIKCRGTHEVTDRRKRGEEDEVVHGVGAECYKRRFEVTPATDRDRPEGILHRDVSHTRSLTISELKI